MRSILFDISVKPTGTPSVLGGGRTRQVSPPSMLRLQQQQRFARQRHCAPRSTYGNRNGRTSTSSSNSSGTSSGSAITAPTSSWRADSPHNRPATPAANGNNNNNGSSGGGSSSRPPSRAAAFLASLPFNREPSPTGARDAKKAPLAANVAARLRAGAGGSASGGAGGYNPASGNGTSGSGSAAGGRPSWLPAAAAEGEVEPFVIAALAPVAAWAFTWALTRGLGAVADAALSGLGGVAAALYPDPPSRGATPEDVAAALLKGLLSGAPDEAAWRRPGLWLPPWLSQGLMRLFHTAAAASAGLALTLARAGPWMALCSLSQALLCAGCFLSVLLPLSGRLREAATRAVGTVADAAARALPSVFGALGSPDGGSGGGYASSSAAAAAAAPAHRWQPNDATALSLKLAALLAWPCLSAATVAAALAPGALAPAPPLSLALPRLLAAAAGVALLVTLGLAAAAYARDIGAGGAGDDAAVDFGLQVGLLCGAQAALNLVQLFLGLAAGGGGVSPRDALAALLSTAVVARVAASVWALQAEPAPRKWLDLLSLDKLAAANPRAGAA